MGKRYRIHNRYRSQKRYQYIGYYSQIRIYAHPRKQKKCAYMRVWRISAKGADENRVRMEKGADMYIDTISVIKARGAHVV